MLKYDGNKINIKIGEPWSLIELAVLIALFWGEPDLIDALIHFFMSF